MADVISGFYDDHEDDWNHDLVRHEADHDHNH
jgi:hypothetical protein